MLSVTPPGRTGPSFLSSQVPTSLHTAEAALYCILCLLFDMLIYSTRPRTLGGQIPYFFILISKLLINTEHLEGPAPFPSRRRMSNSLRRRAVLELTPPTSFSDLTSQCVPLPHSMLHSCVTIWSSLKHNLPQAYFLCLVNLSSFLSLESCTSLSHLLETLSSITPVWVSFACVCSKPVSTLSILQLHCNHVFIFLSH